MEIKNQNVDNVVPKSKWEFDADVAHCFANMLERSIPDYRSMRSLVYELGERFIKPQTVITDIGCSTGLAVEPFFNKHGDNNAYFLCDNSEAMIEVCRDKFSVGISGGYVELVNGNFFDMDIPDKGDGQNEEIFRHDTEVRRAGQKRFKRRYQRQSGYYKV